MVKKMKDLFTLSRSFLSQLSLVALFGSISLASFGQVRFDSKLRTLFSAYHENALQEKIFIHTSKNNFIAGETLYFKIYSVDGMEHRPLEVSQVCYVELLSAANFPVVQVKTALKDGAGSGTLNLPDSLNSGNYKLIGYTSWMKNFTPDYFFSKQISVLNPLESTTIRPQPDSQSAIRFFPEGGAMINGIPGKIAFHGLSSDGKGIDFNGMIVDEKNDTLLSFKPSKFGIGSFHLTPQPGKSYRAYIESHAGNFMHQLPAALDSGLSMQLMNGNEDNITIRVRCNEMTLRKKEVLLFAHNRQRGQLIISALLDDTGEAVIQISKDQLEDGITHFTLFDNELRPRAERLYFRRPRRLLTIEAKQLSNTFGKRTPTTVSITTKSMSDKPVQADLSLSIFRIDAVQSVDSVDIVNYLLLTSDLRGRIESPAYYFSGREAERADDVDHLMLTHGWSRFRWEDVLNAKYPNIQFSPENEGHQVRMTVTDETDRVVPKAFVFLSVPSRRIQLYSSQSNSEGKVQFQTKDIFGKNEVVIQHLGQAAQKYIYSFISPFTDKYPAGTPSALRINTDESELIRSYSVHQQVASAFNSNSLHRTVNIDSVSVFGFPDKGYMLSDYVKFPLLKDVLLEYVPEVIVRRREKKTNLFVLDKERQVFFESEPLILLDGVPVFDTDRIIDLPAQHFEKVEVITEKFYFGMFSFTGVVLFTTKDGISNGARVNPEAIVLDYEGLQIPREFYEPVYHGVTPPSQRQPDFRNVLVWKPDISTGHDGSVDVTFSTSDLPGKYVGIVHGLTRDGMPGSTTFAFEVGNAR
jgi:hypothetical protein